MVVVAVGLSHRTVSFELLERATIAGERLSKALGYLVGRGGIHEAVILSTCHRTEIYAVADRFHDAVHEIEGLLADVVARDPAELADSLFTYHDEIAVSHLFEVAAGIDSVVPGESEIVGQVRRALDVARDERAVGAVLGRLFQHAVETGKRVRTETEIARGTTSIAHAAIELAITRRPLASQKVVIVGAGEMSARMAEAVVGRGATDVTIVNRTAARGKALADSVGARAVDFSQLEPSLATADLFFVGIAATELLLDADAVARTRLAQRADVAELLIVDVGMPRVVDSTVGQLAGVELVDMEGLKAYVEQRLVDRHGAIADARKIVAEEALRYASWASARDVAPLITALHARAESIRLGELERLGSRWAELDPHTQELFDNASRAIVAKLLHDPTMALKAAAGAAGNVAVVEALRRAFLLSEDTSER